MQGPIEVTLPETIRGARFFLARIHNEAELVMELSKDRALDVSDEKDEGKPSTETKADNIFWPYV